MIDSKDINQSIYYIIKNQLIHQPALGFVRHHNWIVVDSLFTYLGMEILIDRNYSYSSCSHILRRYNI